MVTINRLIEGDRPRWEALFRGYNSFYGRTDPPQTMFNRTWSRLISDLEMHCIVARADVDGEVLGLVHFLQHPSTTSNDVMYLQDLYTDPSARGMGVARALISAVAEEAASRGCSRVYWTTRRSNATARRLYDRIAEDDDFMVYRIPLQQS